MWEAIVAGQVTKTGSGAGGELWQLPDDREFIGGASRMLNRTCYNALWEDIKTARETAGEQIVSCVLVRGTPGIGKTTFLNRVLFELYAEMKREEDKGGLQRRIAMTTRGGVCHVLSIADGAGVVRVFNDETVDYWLADNHDILSTQRKLKLVLLVSSDRPTNFNEFMKRQNENFGSDIRADLWSLDELRAARPPKWSEEMVAFRYAVFGGSARNAFARRTRGPRNRDVENWMKTYFASSPAVNPDDAEWRSHWNSALGVITQSITNAGETPAPGSTDIRSYSSMTVHRDSGGMPRWASDFMRSLVGHLCESNKAIFWETAMERLGANESAEGVLFESRCHNIIIHLRPLLRLRNGDCARMGLPQDMNHIRFVDLAPLLTPSATSAPVFHISDTSCVVQVPLGSYGWPAKCNFPVIDAVIQPSIVLQFTVSKTHGVNTDRLREIRAGLQEQDTSKHMLIFVVPATMLKSFKIPTNVDVPMFVSTLDNATATMFKKGR